MSWSLRHPFGGGNASNESYRESRGASSGQHTREVVAERPLEPGSVHTTSFSSTPYNHGCSTNTNGRYHTGRPSSQAVILVPIEDQLQYEREVTSSLRKQINNLERIQKQKEEEHENELAKAKKAAKSYWERISGAESESKQISAERNELEKQRNFLRGELDRERDFTDRLQAELENTKKSLGKAQSAIFEKLSNVVSTELSDDEIRTEFEAIFEESRSWAQENYRLESIDAEKLKSILIQEGYLGPDEDFELHNRFNFGMEIFADLLLETVLNHELCNAFLNNPFYVICPALWVQGQHIDTKVPELLQEITEHFQRMGNQEKAITWRSETVKLFRENYDSEQHKVEAVSRVFAQAFAQKRCSLIRQPIDDEEKNALVDIFASFMKLSAKLWSLKTDIQFHGLEHFGGKDITFQSSSPEMSSARICGLGDGSTELDGRPIPLVLQPKIDASPRIRGRKEVTRRTIWAKAVVWISNQPKPKAVRKAPPKLRPRQKPSLLEVQLLDQADTGLPSKRKAADIAKDARRDVVMTENTELDQMENSDETTM